MQWSTYGLPLLLLCATSLWADGESAHSTAFRILEQKCLRCHNAAERKGGLSLAERQDALRGGDSGPAVMPARAGGSLLLVFVSGDKPEMPRNSAPLTADEIAILHKWIESGASWPGDRKLIDRSLADGNWWSLRPLVQPNTPGRPAVPLHNLRAGAKQHPVDAFIEAQLSQQRLMPMPQAEPLTLIRRLAFDLTGLPPTPQEVESFVKDFSSSENGDEAVDVLVDRLLSSPAFGEKWARHWLDVVRYGETHGYDKDKPRINAWPYRDYVIRSFNEDKPYARFAQEQIAGDALFPGESDGVLGLGFLTAGPWDFIGHAEVGEAKVDGRIAKHLDRDEMISAVYNVFLSTTVQCAQCHNHKFDPVRMEDYYRLHSVFAAVDRADRVYTGISQEQERQQKALAASIKRLREERKQFEEALKRDIAPRTLALNKRIAELKQMHGAALAPQYGWHSELSEIQDAVKWVQVDLGASKKLHHVRLIAAFDMFNGIGAGFGFPVRYKVEVSDDAEFKLGVLLVADATGEDQSNPKSREVSVNCGGASARFIRVTATRLAPRKDDFIFALGEFEVVAGKEQQNHGLGAKVTSLDSIEAPPRWSRANLTDGIFYTELSDRKALSELRQLEDQRALIEAEAQTSEAKARLAAIDEKLSKLTKELKTFPPGEIVFAAATDFSAQDRFVPTGGKPRPIHLLHRGDIRSPGDMMRPGMPPLWPNGASEFMLPANAPEAEGRAMLARAITSRENPLFWRSIANRLWQWTFGQPLVGTPNDFGRMGLQPTHPELLDWLAIRLRDDPKHSLKAIVRLLVTSRAYRRASTHEANNAQLDANNAFLWRSNRRRLTAEEYRDAVLFVSDKLRLDQRGGRSFQDFVIEKPEHSPHYEYHLHDPDDPKSHRRTIYRFIVRSQPQPFLTALDCADPSLSVPARDESTTALQALAQWNDRFVEVMCRHLAHRLQREAKSPAAQVELACRLALGRPPNEMERSVLGEYTRTHGVANLARVIFNLNAFIYVD